MIVRLRNLLPAELLAPYQLVLADPPAPLDWRTVFGDEAPVELEVGHGKGGYLLESALLRPDVRFVGVEVSRKRHLFTTNRIAKRGLKNVRLVLGRAQDLLARHVPAGSLAAIHVYFPDPWWKKRHEKRRVFTPEFVALCAQALRPGGLLRFASDVPDRFSSMLELVQADPAFAEVPAAEPLPGPEVVTNFEAKALLAARPIQRAAFCRR